MPELTGTCENCAYFKELTPPPFSGIPQEHGECRIRSVPTNRFPLRSFDDWCGEYATDETLTLIESLQELALELDNIRFAITEAAS